MLRWAQRLCLSNPGVKAESVEDLEYFIPVDGQSINPKHANQLFRTHKDNLQLIKVLIQKKVKSSSIDLFSEYQTNPEMIELLIENEYHLLGPVNPLYLFRHNQEMFNRLFELIPINKTYMCKTIIHNLCQNLAPEDLPILQYVLDHDANPDCRYDHKTGLYYVASGTEPYHLEAAEMLFQAGADPDLGQPVFEIETQEMLDLFIQYRVDMNISITHINMKRLPWILQKHMISNGTHPDWFLNNLLSKYCNDIDKTRYLLNYTTPENISGLFQTITSIEVCNLLLRFGAKCTHYHFRKQENKQIKELLLLSDPDTLWPYLLFSKQIDYLLHSEAVQDWYFSAPFDSESRTRMYDPKLSPLFSRFLKAGINMDQICGKLTIDQIRYVISQGIQFNTKNISQKIPKYQIRKMMFDSQNMKKVLVKYRQLKPSPKNPDSFFVHVLNLPTRAFNDLLLFL